MLRLEKIHGQNVRDILQLKVAENQKHFIAGNGESIIEAYLTITGNGYVFPFGVYDDDTPVGFLMISFGVDEYRDNVPVGATDFYHIWRLMIDEKYQNRGYGRKTVKLALDFINTLPCGKSEYCWLSYEPENEIARHLYHSFGFEETGEKLSKCGEVIAVLKL